MDVKEAFNEIQNISALGPKEKLILITLRAHNGSVKQKNVWWQNVLGVSCIETVNNSMKALDSLSLVDIDHLGKRNVTNTVRINEEVLARWK